MEHYDYALGAEAVHAFTGLSAKRRERLLKYFASMAAKPSTGGDYQEPGQAERKYEVRLVDDFIITWWVDHAAREVRVLRIEET